MEPIEPKIGDIWATQDDSKHYLIVDDMPEYPNNFVYEVLHMEEDKYDFISIMYFTWFNLKRIS